MAKTAVRAWIRLGFGLGSKSVRPRTQLEQRLDEVGDGARCATARSGAGGGSLLRRGNPHETKRVKRGKEASEHPHHVANHGAAKSSRNGGGAAGQRWRLRARARRQRRLRLRKRVKEGRDTFYKGQKGALACVSGPNTRGVGHGRTRARVQAWRGGEGGADGRGLLVTPQAPQSLRWHSTPFHKLECEKLNNLTPQTE